MHALALSFLATLVSALPALADEPSQSQMIAEAKRAAVACDLNLTKGMASAVAAVHPATEVRHAGKQRKFTFPRAELRFDERRACEYSVGGPNTKVTVQAFHTTFMSRGYRQRQLTDKKGRSGNYAVKGGIAVYIGRGIQIKRTNTGFENATVTYRISKKVKP